MFYLSFAAPAPSNYITFPSQVLLPPYFNVNPPLAGISVKSVKSNILILTLHFAQTLIRKVFAIKGELIRGISGMSQLIRGNILTNRA